MYNINKNIKIFFEDISEEIYSTLTCNIRIQGLFTLELFKFDELYTVLHNTLTEKELL